MPQIRDNTQMLGGANMKKIISLLFIAGLTGAGCTTTEETAGRMSIQAQVPPETRSAMIRPMPMQLGALKNVNLHDAPQIFAGYLKDALSPGRPTWRITVADEKAPAPEADITISTELTLVDGGSAAMRFWIGFGAGAITSVAQVSISDKSGRTLAASEITQRTSCPLGACGEENEVLVRENLKQLAASAAEFVSNPAEYERKRRQP